MASSLSVRAVHQKTCTVNYRQLCGAFLFETWLKTRADVDCCLSAYMVVDVTCWGNSPAKANTEAGLSRNYYNKMESSFRSAKPM